jgi:3-deoxy-D-manno-octulosonate 8-phosphate phosphatase KdsC-like HAD superfamily phosphatase
MTASLSLGKHYFEIAMLFGESMFLNGILTNSEIWYNLSESEIKEFEDLDRLLLRRILQVSISTPKEAWSLEFFPLAG